MGRSVSVPTGATVVCYRHIDYDDDVDLAQFLWDDLVDWIRESAKQAWPSLYNVDRWLDREDHAILANHYCYIGVSEYCGLVSVWIVPDEERALSAHWCTTIGPKFCAMFSELRPIARASNGEVFFW